MQRDDFAKFFAAVNDGATPFGWQERLLDTVLENRRWPERIAAPTGTGKTSAIDVHVFAVALTADDGVRLPRRLAMVVDRRVLVDDQYQRARRLAAMLTDRKDDLMGEIADRLAVMRWPAGKSGQPAQDDSPLVVARMRGGAMPSRSWRDHPSACAVLCATPDMWGSRLLFRGYGTSTLAAPREAGLLAFDSAVLVDEAHLAGQLLVTARQVARLAGVSERPPEGVPVLQVVEMTATPTADDAQVTVAVGPDDLTDDLLADRLTRPKPVTLWPVDGWPAQKAPKTAHAVVEAVIAMLSQVQDHPGAARTVGCFVNTVPMAVEVAKLLRPREGADGAPLRVVMLCGQVRPADLDLLRHEHPGILTTGGSAGVDVIVSTQSLEVGVDLDLAGIVSELAAGSALAQRAGRANRRGLRSQAPVTVLVPAEPPGNNARSGPYTGGELSRALSWVRERAADPCGMAPWAVRQDPPPPAERRRLLFQRPELAEVWHWARTSDDLAAEPELELWLADSLDDETSVGIVVRDAMPDDPASAVELVRELPPRSWEVFPVPYRTARAVLSHLVAPTADLLSPVSSGGPAVLRPIAVRLRGEEPSPLEARTTQDGQVVADIRPGDIVLIDSAEAIFTPEQAGVFSPPVVVPTNDSDPDSQGLADRGTARDVLHMRSQPREGELVLRLEARADKRPVGGLTVDDAMRRRLADLEESSQPRRQLAEALGEFIAAGGIPPELLPLVRAVREVLGKPAKYSALRVHSTDETTRVIVTDLRRVTADEDLRQVFSFADREITLGAHQSSVANRARLLAERVGFGPDLIGGLELAGEHHDDGKRDPRFQAFRLGADHNAEPLAKSPPTTSVRRAREMAHWEGLPDGWRHEQRSVIDSWDAVLSQTVVDPDLVLRLIGTSHGRGRSSFPHGGAGLGRAAESESWFELAAAMFDEGGWDALVERTQTRYGVWGCAYLEALLRAADCQISGEGG